MLGFVAFLFALPAAAVAWFPVRRVTAARQAGCNAAPALASVLTVVLVIFASYQPFASAMRNHKQLRYLLTPLNSVYALGSVPTKSWRRNNSVLELIGADAAAPAPSARPPLLVLVVGETARSANFGLNGCARQTTPALAREDVVSFRDVSACGTDTAASLPCMFSHLGRRGFDKRPRNYENLLDVLQRAGLAVVWLDNQSGCKGVCDRVPHPSTQPLDPEFCAGSECLDGVLVKQMAAKLSALSPDRRARGPLQSRLRSTPVLQYR